MLRIAGLVLFLIGTFAGVLILAGPFGGAPRDVVGLWLLFGIGFFGGLLMAALGSHGPGLAPLVRVSGILLLVLGVGSAAALLLDRMHVLNAYGSTRSLWLLLLVGTVAGCAGLLGPTRKPA